MLLPRPPERASGLGLTSLVDVIFLLLLFFVVTTSFEEPRIELRLPEVEQASAPWQRETLRIELRRSGEILADGAPVEIDALDALLVEHAARGDALELRADRDVRHGRVVELLDRARASDVLEISIAVEARRGSE